jgi:hypothetical protein
VRFLALRRFLAVASTRGVVDVCGALTRARRAFGADAARTFARRREPSTQMIPLARVRVRVRTGERFMSRPRVDA